MSAKNVGIMQRLGAAWGLVTGKRNIAEAVFGPASNAYKGAGMNRLLSDWIVSFLHIDDEIRGSARLLRLRARDLGRNNAYVKQFLVTTAVNVLGPHGIRLQAQVENNNGSLARDVNDRIEAAWDKWSLRPTRDGKLSRVRFEHLLLKAVARDGEVFVRMHRSFAGNEFRFALEAIDADMIDLNYTLAPGRGPEVRLGVEVNADGAPTAYYMWDRPERAAGVAPRTRIRIPADEIIHLYDPDRANQTRGVTWLTSIMFPLRQLQGYTEAELVAARIAAAKMGFFSRKTGEGGPTPDGEDVDTSSLQMEVNPGTFEILPDGYGLETWSPDHPNAAFPAFLKANLREIATGMSMSYNALANDLEGVNYSSLRSGMLVEREFWRSVQTFWIDAFLTPVYAEWLNMALLSGALKLGTRDFRKFLAVKWVPRGWAWVDPLKDVQASVAAIQAGLTSRTQVLAEQGMDFETVLAELEAEDKLADQYDVDISGPAGPSAPAAAAGSDAADAETAGTEADTAKAKKSTSSNGTNGNGNGHGIPAAIRRRFMPSNRVGG